MMKIYSITKKHFAQLQLRVFSIVFLAIFSAFTSFAQTYINGNLSTGALNSLGVAAPAGSTWSEVQLGNSISALPATNGSYLLADDFFVCGNWKVTKFTFYGIVNNSSATGTPPFNNVKLAIYSSDPSVGNPTPVYGTSALTTNYFNQSYYGSMYRVSNGASATDAAIWKVEASVGGAAGVTLNPNTKYWVVYSLGTTSGAPCFSPTSTVVGTTTQYQNNAKSKDISTGSWSTITDGGGVQDLPFMVTYTAPACSGMPVPGATQSSITGSVCPNEDFTLFLSTPPCGTGITYQWQYLPSGSSTWVNITNATTNTFSSSMSTVYNGSAIPTSTQFRAEVKCGTNTAYSTPLTLQSSPFYGCYCIPGFTNSLYDDIAVNVTCGGINNNTNSSPNNGYSDYTTVTWPSPLNTKYGIVYRGQTTTTTYSNPISVTMPPGFVENASVWVDYNHNSVFDANEFTAVGTTTVAGGIVRNYIKIPGSADTGITRMRVRVRYGTGAQLSATETCNGYTWGETEDYLVNIQPTSICSAATTIGDLMTSYSSACSGDSVSIYPNNFSALLGIRSLTFEWQKSNSATGPWTAITNTNSVAYTPIVTSTQYYRLKATCNPGGFGTPSVDTTPAILITMKPPSECYCKSIASYAPGPEIYNVTLGTLNNSSDCNTVAPGPGTSPNKYSNYTEGVGAPAAPQLNQGATTPFSVNIDFCGTGTLYFSTLYIWIDLNHNGAFDTDEMVFTPASSDYNNTYPRTVSGNITIPTTALTGLTRMRLVNSYNTGIDACSVYLFGETEDYLVNISAAAPCGASTPAGIITSSVNPVCASTPFTLSASNLSGYTGLSYQWQSSPNGTTWTNISAASGGTANTYTGTLTATTQYRLQTTCSVGGTKTSNVITETLSTTNCYCIPNPSTCTTDYMDSVWMGGVGNFSACTAGGYSSYVGTIDDMPATRGGANTIKVRAGAVGGSQYVAAWIDYNKNGTFETTEFTALGQIAAAGTFLNGTINIPATAQTGQLRMRVRMRRGTAFANTDACTTITNGETEDYQIDVAGCQPVAITAQSGNQIVDCGTNAQFFVNATASTTIIYKWLYRTGNTGAWTPVVNGGIFSGATNDTLTLTAPNLTYSGYNFCVAMTGSCTTADTSSVFTLQVNPSGNVNFATQPPAAPSITCAGNGTIGFTLSPVPAGTTYQWQVKTAATAPWVNVTASANFTGVTSNTLNLVAIPITFNGYKFRAYVNSTCYAPDTTDVSTITVVGTSLSLSIATPNTTICKGSPATYTATPTPATGLPSPSFKWYINNIATATAPSVGTTITVDNTSMLSVGNGVSVASGTGAFAANTTVTAITSATTFTVSAAPLVALANGTIISGLVQNGASTSYTTSILVGEPEIKCVLLVNDQNGCVVPNPATSNIIDMVITDNVPTSVDLTVPSSTVCQGAPVTFTATPGPNAGTNPTYQFYVGTTSVQGPGATTTYSTSALTNGAIVKCYMMSNATNCPAPLPARDSITMIVNPSPAVSVTLNASPGVNVCPGTQVTFTATGVNAGTSPTYTFKKNGTQVQTGASATYVTNTLVTNDIITCVLNSNVSTCATGNPATSNALTMSVSNQVASVTLSSSPNPVCAGVPVTYTATAVNGGATPTYQFYVNGSPRANTGNSFTYTPTDNDSVSVKMFSALPCALPSPATAYIIQDMRESPTASIESSAVTCGAGYAVLDPGASIGTGATITGYQWQLNGANIAAPAGTGEFLYATTNGSYVINITASNGCTFSSPTFSLTVPTTAAPLAGGYTIGDVTAVNASSSGTTITVTSTANLVVGALLYKTSGTGTLASNTIITQIISATQFKVNVAPTVALSAASLAGRTCTNYESFATAISDLNTRSISAACTIDVTAGYTETLTQRLDLGSATLNNASSTRSIVFQKLGTGANPTLTSYAGTGLSNSPIPDGMLALSGVDNVTIDGINFVDPNTASATTMMEYGIGLFRLSATDGARNNTIKNCSITLNRNNITTGSASMPEGSNGIIMINALSTTAGVALTAGGTVGSNSGNKFYSNTITNCYNGIVLTGFAATNTGTTPADGDVNNDIGGTSTATANSILNFGGGTGATLTASGIRLNNQWGANVSYNTINNNNGTGVNHPNALTGIWAVSGTSANVAINNNTITLNGGGTTQGVTAIDNAIGSTPASNTVNINNNIISGGYPTMTSGSWKGINNAATPATVNINNNTVQNITLPAGTTTGTFTGISNSGLTTLNLNYNTIQNVTLPGTGAFTGISNSAGIITTLNIKGNNVINNTKSSTGTMNLIAVGAPAAPGTVTISNDTISGNKIIGGGAACTMNCISQTGSSFYAVNNCLVSNNSITSMSGAVVGTINGYSNLGSNQVESIYNNTINNLFITGTSTGQHLIRGIYNNPGATSTRNVYGNTINNLYTNSTSSAIVTGIDSRSGGTVNIYKNKIYNIFSGQNATAATSLAKGIGVTTGTTVSVFNNMISIDLTQASTATAGVAAGNVLNGADVVRGIDLGSSLAASNDSVYFNTIYLNGTGAGLFGSSGIYHTASATASTATLHLKNNIIDNECTSVGGGFVVAFRRSAGTAGQLANYASSSNNNSFYAGTPTTTNLIYYDGTSSAQTLAQYQTGAFTAGNIAPRDANSVSVSPDFVSTTDLHLIGISPSNVQLDSTGAPIATSNPDLQTDIDNQTRPTAPTRPDIGADQFASSSFTGQVNSNATICSGSSGTLTLVSYSGTIVRWEYSTDSISWTPIANSTSATYNYSNITAPTYFHAIVTNTTLGLTDASQAALLSINPLPQISSTAAAGPYVTTASVCIGGTLQLYGNGTVAPTNAWVSGTTSVAGVSLTGLVTGVIAGTSLITYTNNNGCKGILTLTVGAAPAITGTATVCVGATTQLTGAGTPATTNPWVSATTAVATVSNTGLVTGVSAGTSVITYTNNGGCAATKTVTVSNKPTITGNTTLCLNTNTTLVGSPTAATTGAWSSTAPTIVSVNGSGQINALAVGTSTIRYTNSNGCFKDTVVTVVALPIISLTSGGTAVTSVNSCIGTQTNLFSNSTGGSWSSSNTAVASVSSSGVVSALTAGTCNITFVSSGSCAKTVVFTINTKPSITGIDSVCVGATTQLIGSGTAATSNPWVSLTPAIASVSNTGLVTGVSGGNCNVVYFNNNGCSDTITIKVNALPTLYSVTGGGSACSNSNGVSVGLSNAQNGIEYQLIRQPNINIGSPLTGNGSALDFGLQTTAGTYAVLATNTQTGCSVNMTGTATVSITTLPTATISYSSGVFCKTVTSSQAVTLTGTTSGTYTAAPTGLTLNGTTGAIVPSTSNAGDYLITYTIPASGGCAIVTATANVTITTAPIATFSYTGSPYCQTGSNPVPSLATGAEYGTFTASPAGLVFVPNSSGEVDVLASANGTYTVTNSIAAANGCAQVQATATITITQTSNVGPLSGVYNIPGSTCRDFRTIASAINYLNTNGVSGPVTFQVASDYNETLLSTLALGPLPVANNTTATNRIRFVKTGSGANPKITAHAGSNLPNSSAAVDGIWSLRGVDFVTIDGIDLYDPNAASAISTTASSANSGTTINVASTSGITPGMTVIVTSGSGAFPVNDTVVSVTSATQFVVNAAPSANLANGTSLYLTSGKPMEYGFGLFKTSATDGAQFDSIKNSTITLNRNNVTPGATFFNGAVGIAVQGSTASNVLSLLSATAVAGGNSFNTIVSNTIQNCNIGIGINGGTSGTGGIDSTNTIGDTTNIGSVYGNSIINFGGGGDVNSSSASYGIYLQNQSNAKVGNNIINNNQNTNGVNHKNNQYGIATITSGASSIFIKQNSINITGGADKSYYGIDNQTGSFIVDISSNTISVNIPSSITTFTGSVSGITNNTTSAITNINISGNSFKTSALSGSGAWTGIYNRSNGSSSSIIQMNDNVIDSNLIASTGTFVGLQSDASTYAKLYLNRNRIANNSKVNNASELNWIYQKSGGSGSGDLYIENNTIEKDTVITASGNTNSPSIYAIRVTGAKTGSSINVDNNFIAKQFVKDINGTTSATLRGYNSVLPIGQTPTENIYNNKISNLYISATSGNTGSHNIFGIQSGGSATGGSYAKNIYGNRIDTLYVRQQAGVNSIIAAIYNSGSSNGNALNIYKNKISHLVPYGVANTSVARGIWIQSTATNAVVNLNNNMINLDLSAAFDGAVSGVLTGSEAVKGIDLAQTAVNTVNMYYNTVRIAGTGGAGFGTSALSIASNNPVLKLQNNIFVNKSVPGTGGTAVAMRRANASTALNYLPASSNNLYYAGVPSASNLLFNDAGTTYQTLSGLWISAGGGREANSFGTFDPVFVSAADFSDSLHLSTSVNCKLDSAGIIVASVTDDIDGQLRNATKPDIGADEFAGPGSPTRDTFAIACQTFDWYGTTYTVTPTVNPTHTINNVNGCDSIIVLHLTINSGSNTSTTQTACDSFVWNGVTYTASGTYTYSFTNGSNCSSTDTLHLTITNSTHNASTQVACESYLWNGVTYTASGDYTYSYNNASGCASVDTLHLTVNFGTYNSVTQTACDSYTWNGTTYTVSGNYTYSYTNTSSCPSVDTLHLTVNYGTHNAVTQSACEIFTWNGTTYTASGDYTYSYTNTSGCASVDTLHLTVNYGTHNSVTQVACESYVWNAVTYTISGDYTYSYNNNSGCASVDTLHLTINNATHNTTNQTACTSYDWNGTTYTTTGDYTYNYINASGCASVDTLHLTITNGVPVSTTIAACDSYVWNGITYTVSGDYTFTNTGTCSSVDTLHLTINNATHNATTQAACGSYLWNGVTYTTSGNYTYSYTNASGCASVDTLHLTINTATHNGITQTACDNFVWNGVTYTASGNYTYSYTNTSGCASVDTLHLTVNNSTHNSVTQSACGSYLWNGNTYTTSGNYTYSYTNTFGCASVDTLHLTITNGVPVSTTISACDSYTWNGVVYTASGNYTHANTGTCASVDTLHLTINTGTHNTVTQSACGSYLWNGVTYTLSGNYTYSYNNTNGCASVDTLHLTINVSTHNSVTQSSCTSYTWNGVTYTATGNYTYNYTNASGCASVDTLHLTITNGVPVSTTISACDSYTWNGVVYTSSGNYTHANTGTCTSVDTLHLTINSSTHNATTQVACGSYLWNGVTYTTSGNYTFSYANTNGCASTDTLHLTINASGSWLGVSANWNDPANWCGGVIPTSTTNVTIPAGLTIYPIINATSTTPTPACANITIVSGARVDLLIGGKLKINGSISTATGAVFNALDGTIELAGTTPQTIPLRAFQNNNIRNLIINNASVTLGDSLNLFGKLSFSGSNRVFNVTNGKLTLKSSALLTASVGDMTKDINTQAVISGNQINGDVTVERYISAKRAWRLLSMPTKHNLQTIQQSFQEGGVQGSNPVPGYGTQLSSNRASWLADGFDINSSSPSIKVLNPQANSWDGIISTKNVTTPNASTGKFELGKAYFTFIRGDRSVTQSTQAPTTTILREKGALQTGSYTFNFNSTAAGQNVGVGNPYASPIDFKKLTLSGVQNMFYIWDPALGVYGAYQTCNVVGGNIVVAPGGGSYANGNFNIQSGQGFIAVASAPTASITFNESCKVDSNNLVSRYAAYGASIRTQLYQVQNGNPVLFDGVLNMYDESYTNMFDAMDVDKLTNSGENIAINNNGKQLSIESRNGIGSEDTIFYNINHMKVATYQLNVIPENLSQSGLQAYLEDSYLQSRTAIDMNLGGKVNFNINNDPASYATDRFRLVFNSIAPPSVFTINVKSETKGSEVIVDWDVQHASSIRKYVVQQSVDGINYFDAAEQPATVLNHYVWIDQSPFMGVNYYRIKAIDNSGRMIYSNPTKCFISIEPMITVFPNPIKEDKQVKLKIENSIAGNYKINMFDNSGKLVFEKTIYHPGGIQTYSLHFNVKMAKGLYHLELIDSRDTKTNLKVQY